MTQGDSASDLAQRLGLKRFSRSWRGSCPACDYSNAFAVKAGRDQRPLVFCANGCDQALLADTLKRCVGEGWAHPPKEPDLDVEARRTKSAASALAIWNGSCSLYGTVADQYLTRRGLPGLASSDALRFRGDCHHPEQKGRYPALVALVVDVSGAPIGIHRTYLASGGCKAALEPVKASKGGVWAGAIRLDPEAPEIVIGEGLETSASAGRLFGLPAWAALSAGNLAQALILPSAIRSVVIAADRDPPGERATQQAAARWRLEGRRVRIVRPNIRGQDFNDILLQHGEPHHAG